MVRTAGLAFVLVAAAGLRIAGIAFDQPYVYYPDEYAVAKPAMLMVATGNPNPGLSSYPAFLLYAESGVVKVVHAATGASLDTAGAGGYGGLAGSSPSDLQTSQYPYVLWGRWLVGFLSLLTVLLLAVAGRVAARSQRARMGASATTEESPSPATSARDRELGWLAGMVGAVFFALAILPLDYSRYLTTDVPSALFTAATCLAALAAVSRPPDRTSDRFLILSGVFVGVAASTKYTAAVVAIVPVVAYLTRAGSLRAVPRWLPGAVRSRTPYLVALAAVAAFILVTPMILFDTRTVIHGALFEVSHYNVVGNPGAEGDSGGYYINYLWTTGFGPVLSVLALAGIGWAIVRHRASDLVLVVFPIVYILLISIPRVHFERNLMPLVPFVALLAGRFAIDLAAALQGLIGRRRPLLGTTAAAVLVAALLVQPASAAVGDAQANTLPRTETVALEWVNAHLASGSAIVREEYTPQLDTNRYRVGYIWTLSSHDLDWYRSQGFRYAIASSRLYARYLASGYPTEGAFYNGLFSLPTVHEVQPSSSLAGPTIVILDLQAGLATQQTGP